MIASRKHQKQLRGGEGKSDLETSIHRYEGSPVLGGLTPGEANREWRGVCDSVFLERAALSEVVSHC